MVGVVLTGPAIPLILLGRRKRLADLAQQAVVTAAVELYVAEPDVHDEELGCDVMLIARPEHLPECPARTTWEQVSVQPEF